MHEMLGNQYFLARQYSLAEKELEAALLHNPTSISIKKKLIICHTQTNTIHRALDIFIDAIGQNIHAITDTDPILENCPCPQLVFELENSLLPAEGIERHLVLGMLWLYCDIEMSLKHFLAVSHHDKKIEYIVSQLQSTIQQLHSRRNT